MEYDYTIQASVIVRYHGPTDNHCSRHTVSLGGTYLGSVPYNHQLSHTAQQIRYAVQQVLNSRRDLPYIPGKVFAVNGTTHLVELIAS